MCVCACSLVPKPARRTGKGKTFCNGFSTIHHNQERGGHPLWPRIALMVLFLHLSYLVWVRSRMVPGCHPTVPSSLLSYPDPTPNTLWAIQTHGRCDVQGRGRAVSCAPSGGKGWLFGPEPKSSLSMAKAASCIWACGARRAAKILDWAVTVDSLDLGQWLWGHSELLWSSLPDHEARSLKGLWSRLEKGDKGTPQNRLFQTRGVSRGRNPKWVKKYNSQLSGSVEGPDPRTISGWDIFPPTL